MRDRVTFCDDLTPKLVLCSHVVVLFQGTPIRMAVAPVQSTPRGKASRLSESELPLALLSRGTSVPEVTLIPHTHMHTYIYNHY